MTISLRWLGASIVVMGALVGCSGGGGAGSEQTGSSSEAVKDPELRPNGRGIGTAEKFAGRKHGGGGANGISFHGGPVMLGTTGVYYIWYGNWAGRNPGA